MYRLISVCMRQSFPRLKVNFEHTMMRVWSELLERSSGKWEKWEKESLSNALTTLFSAQQEQWHDGMNINEIKDTEFRSICRLLIDASEAVAPLWFSPCSVRTILIFTMTKCQIILVSLLPFHIYTYDDYFYCMCLSVYYCIESVYVLCMRCQWHICVGESGWISESHLYYK